MVIWLVGRYVVGLFGYVVGWLFGSFVGRYVGCGLFGWLSVWFERKKARGGTAKLPYLGFA